jgi:6-phosphofructokinase 1
MGVAAVEGLINGQQDVMVGISNSKIVYNSYDSLADHHEIDDELMRIAKILSI